MICKHFAASIDSFPHMKDTKRTHTFNRSVLHQSPPFQFIVEFGNFLSKIYAASIIYIKLNPVACKKPTQFDLINSFHAVHWNKYTFNIETLWMCNARIMRFKYHTPKSCHAIVQFVRLKCFMAFNCVYFTHKSLNYRCRHHHIFAIICVSLAALFIHAERRRPFFPLGPKFNSLFSFKTP